MSNKINLREIVEDHVATLRDGDSKATSRADIWTFFIAPLLGGVALAVLGCLGWKVWLKDAGADTLITALSILSALLFSLIILLYQEGSSIDCETLDPRDLAHLNRAERKIRAIEETYANTAFCILEGLFAIVLLVATKLSPLPAKAILSGFAIAGCTVFLLTLLMILGRTQILFRHEVRTRRPPKAEPPKVERLIEPDRDRP